jgi:hypothetical protein
VFIPIIHQIDNPIYRRDPMNHRERIRRIATEESPDYTVEFDEDAMPKIRFNIKNGLGTVISRAYPHFDPSEIQRLDDNKLRSIIRGLCGLSH